MLGQAKLSNALLEKRYGREGDQFGIIEWETQIYPLVSPHTNWQWTLWRRISTHVNTYVQKMFQEKDRRRMNNVQLPGHKNNLVTLWNLFSKLNTH